MVDGHGQHLGSGHTTPPRHNGLEARDDDQTQVKSTKSQVKTFLTSKQVAVGEVAGHLAPCLGVCVAETSALPGGGPLKFNLPLNHLQHTPQQNQRCNMVRCGTSASHVQASGFENEKQNLKQRSQRHHSTLATTWCESHTNGMI